MADFWVTEAMNGFGMTVQVTEELCSKRSEFQKIDVYQTSKLGRMLTRALRFISPTAANSSRTGRAITT